LKNNKNDAEIRLTHPVTDLNPLVPQPSFPPTLISFIAPALAYKTGFRNPTAPLPLLILSSLINVIKEATTGVDIDVP
jgi:hypothetical protein